MKMLFLVNRKKFLCFYHECNYKQFTSNGKVIMIGSFESFWKGILANFILFRPKKKWKKQTNKTKQNKNTFNLVQKPVTSWEHDRKKISKT